jgi:branched-chain amino acid transport system ATP-binding protein
VTVLSVQDIHTYYGDSYVLQGVSLEARPGQVTAIMGRNGVGKTTTIRSVLGLTPPRQGRVTFDGQDLTAMPTHRIARCGLGLVPQGRRVFPSLTVREHLLTASSGATRVETWTFERLFDLFPNLEDRLDLRATHLSGGEQSMLAIARALRTEPRCLLMDEPTEGLAPIYVDTVVDVIRELRSAGDLALLVVLPELPLALALADHVYVMGKGRVVFQGSRDELQRRKDVQEQHIGIG